MNISKKIVFASAMLAGVHGVASAVPFEVEGKLSYVEIKFVEGTTQIAPSSYIKCNGSTIFLSNATTISTPTNTITAQEFLSPKVLPGRAMIPAADVPAGVTTPQKSAFIGGTCIVEGDDDETLGGRKATALFVEPAENVILGPTTSALGAPFEILGVRIKLLAPHPGDSEPYDNYQPDPVGRIKAGAPINANGIKIRLSTVPKGDEASAEGYLSDDRKTFYAFAVETSGGGEVSPQAYAEAAILRADMTFVSATRVKLEVRGGCTKFPQTVTLELRDGNSPSNLIATASTACTDGTFRYRDDQFVTSATRPAPTSVRASADAGAHYTDPIVIERIGF